MTASRRPGEAERLLGALPERDRPIWATALYAGLRAGELQALAVEHVDFERGLIHVERSWDRRHRTFVTPKSRSGVRRVPLIAPLGQVTAMQAVKGRCSRQPSRYEEETVMSIRPGFTSHSSCRSRTLSWLITPTLVPAWRGQRAAATYAA